MQGSGGRGGTVCFAATVPKLPACEGSKVMASSFLRVFLSFKMKWSWLTPCVIFRCSIYVIIQSFSKRFSYICILFFQVSLHYRLLQEFEYYTVNPCCLSTLDVVLVYPLIPGSCFISLSSHLSPLITVTLFCRSVSLFLFCN